MSKHREIDCPLCEGPVCKLDGDSPCATCEGSQVIYDNRGDITGSSTIELDCPDCSGPEMVYTLTYTHKHGSDVGVYKTRKGAITAALQLATERAEEWDDEEEWEEF